MAKRFNPKAAPLPPAPTPGEFVYARNAQGELSEQPVAVRGAVSVPIEQLTEYRQFYGYELVGMVELENGQLVEILKKKEQTDG